MLIGGIEKPAASRLRASADELPTGDGADCRALVAVSPVVASRQPSYDTRRPMPSFLAHLAATRQRAPQTCAGRRVAPAEAAAAYDAALVPPRPAAGRAVRRSV